MTRLTATGGNDGRSGAMAETGEPIMDVVYLADQGNVRFKQDRLAVDIVCVGDSITGWNNFGLPQSWPYPTYPQFLQQMFGRRAADGGIAGEISDNGLGLVRRYLDLFPNSDYLIIGFGTNDLGAGSELESVSKRIIENLGRMVDEVREREKVTILSNVPYANESLFPRDMAEDSHHRRDYHNERLRAFCQQHSIPLADICSHLRDEHLGDELHPNEAGAKIIAEVVFRVLVAVSRKHESDE